MESWILIFFNIGIQKILPGVLGPNLIKEVAEPPKAGSNLESQIQIIQDYLIRSKIAPFFKTKC